MTNPYDALPENDRPVRQVGEVLGQLTTRLGMARPDATHAVFRGWAEAVGSEVAAHTRPRSLRGGVLTIVVDSSAWATELRYLESKLLVRIEGLAGPGVVMELRSVVDPRGR